MPGDYFNYYGNGTASTTNLQYFTADLTAPALRKYIVYSVNIGAFSASANSGLLPRVFSSEHLAETSTPLEQVGLAWANLHGGYRVLAVETFEEWEAARRRAGSPFDSEVFPRRRAGYLMKRKKGYPVHPNQEYFLAMDKVYWFDNDPNTVDGQPTLFATKYDAIAYGARVFLHEDTTTLEAVLKERKLFSYAG